MQVSYATDNMYRHFDWVEHIQERHSHESTAVSVTMVATITSTETPMLTYKQRAVQRMAAF